MATAACNLAGSQAACSRIAHVCRSQVETAIAANESFFAVEVVAHRQLHAELSRCCRRTTRSLSICMAHTVWLCAHSTVQAVAQCMVHSDNRVYETAYQPKNGTGVHGGVAGGLVVVGGGGLVVGGGGLVVVGGGGLVVGGGGLVVVGGGGLVVVGGGGLVVVGGGLVLVGGGGFVWDHQPKRLQVALLS